MRNISLVLFRYFRIFLTAVQCSISGSLWYLPTKLMARQTSGLVHSMAYIIEPMAEDKEKMSVIPYASAIGSIMYAMLCTRPDVCLAISLVGRYQSDPGVDHWTSVKNILKYLKRTKDMFLVYECDKELVVKGCIDASFDTDPDDSRSQSGYVL